MATIRIKHPHNLGMSAAVAAARQGEELLARYGVKLAWNGNQASVKGSGLSGSMDIGEKDIQIALELGLLLSAASGAIENRLREYLVQVTGVMA